MIRAEGTHALRDAGGTLLRRGLRLEYATLGWNVAGLAVLAVSALKAGSPALAGFGLDSLIHVFASVVVLWHLKGVHRDREAPAMRLIGIAFTSLAAYLIIQLAVVFAGHSRSAPSAPGIVWTALTIVVMLALASGKIRTGRAMGNSVLRAEGKVTLVVACLAAAVLGGLILNALLGWWWADPIAGLVIIYYAALEAVRALTHTNETASA